MTEPARPYVPEPQRRRRVVYVALLTVAFLSTLLSLIVNLGAPQVDPIAVAIGAVALTLFALLALALWWRWASIEHVERGLIVAAALVLLASLSLRLYLPELAPGADLAVMTSVVWFPVLFLMSAMAFRSTTFVRVAGVLYAAFVAATLPSLLVRAGDAHVLRHGPAFWWQVYLSYAVVIIALSFFEGLRQHATAMEDTARSMRRLAHTDMLTGLPNRRACDELLSAELQRAQRYGRVFSVVMIDIDRFKALNDRFGHQAGDDVLVDLARYLGATVRGIDSVARWGGEEFVVVAPETDRADAERLAELLRAGIEQQLLAQRFRVTASLGVASYRAGDSGAELVARADAALYRAKYGGRNRVGREEEPETITA